MTDSLEKDFREIQPVRHVIWILVIIVFVALMIWWGFVQQIIFRQPWGNQPAPDWAMWPLWIVLGIIIPLGALFVRLTVEVTGQDVEINYWPFTRRSLALEEVANVLVISYRPIRDFGGWGIRGWSSRRAYTVRGNEAVELTLRDGNKLVIGSQQPSSLARAIELRRSM